MKYHALFVILKKLQNFKLSSAANYRWHFKVNCPSADYASLLSESDINMTAAVLIVVYTWNNITVMWV